MTLIWFRNFKRAPDVSKTSAEPAFVGAESVAAGGETAQGVGVETRKLLSSRIIRADFNLLAAKKTKQKFSAPLNSLGHKTSYYPP
jgi:hypothetical protein